MARRYRVVIVGGGFSGLGMALELRRHGIDDFIILEKSRQLGGTWRDNTYPGCACDVPTVLYSYSFAPKADWTRFFAGQAEIQAYLLEVAERSGIMPSVQLQTEVLEARFDVDRELWAYPHRPGELEADFVAACQGPLHQPKIPDLPGLADFQGTVFHSARWDHSHPWKGNASGVIGTGSSAIQFIPEIQPRVAQLKVFQRTPSWVLPKPDFAYSPTSVAVFRALPLLQRGLRGALYGLTELLQRAQASNDAMKTVQKLAQRQLRRQVQDPELRQALTPDFTLGCKRMLLSNTYFPALTAPNAQLIPFGVERITPQGVVANGIEHPVDTLIFATGFHITDSALPACVFGRHGTSLAAAWNGTPEAYLGTLVSGFPNLFLLLGPNTGNGHGSAFTIIEAQARYVAQAITEVTARGAHSLEVQAGPQQGWNDLVQDALATSVWNAGGCKSWYLDKNGRNCAIYPWSTVDLRRRLRRFDPAPCAFSPKSANPHRKPLAIALPHALVAITGAARGIGLATARAFVEAGATVALGDLDLDACRDAAAALGPRAHAFPLDVTRVESCSRFIASVQQQLGAIDVWVNNAGVLPTGPFVEQPDARDVAAMQVNYHGMARGMRLILPHMIERGRGHVVNVASLAGKLAVPFMASYSASKHAIVALSAAVRVELEGTGVTLSSVLPTAVKTRMATAIPMSRLSAREPEEVARAIVRSVQTREPELTVPGWAWPVAGLYGLLPRRLLASVSRLFGAERLVAEPVRAARAVYERATVTAATRE